MTIKELADELGVSKDKVKYRLRKLPSELTSKSNGITYLSDVAVTKIREELLDTFTKVKTSENTHTLPTDFIEKELEKKDKEIKEKNKQIEELHSLLKNQNKLLDQQQQLTLQANIKIKELETTLTETDVTEEKETEPTKESVKKSFWQRLFN